MSYRGRKISEHIRLLEKRAQVFSDQDNMYSARHHRTPSFDGTMQRRKKRRQQKLMLEAEAERKRLSDRYLEEAEALLQKKASYPWWGSDSWVQEQVEELRRKAKDALAAEMPGPVTETEKRAAAAWSSIPYSMYSPVKRNPDPQVIALAEAIRSGERNFMDGISYRINPVDTLKMISASSVFGEPQYYRSGESTQATVLDGVYGIDRLFTEYSLRMLDPFKGMTTSRVMEKAIDAALDADFEATLQWAVELRERYMMRLNPQVILVRASVHPGRKAYTEKHPGEFAAIARKVMPRGDDVINQVQYWLAKKRSKKGIPAILKRAWADRISGMDAYSMAKYGNTGIGLVDVVRICHAKGDLVDVLMRNGRVPMPEGENTWERLRASGMKWEQILTEIRMPHMALLRNLRGIFEEVQDPGIQSSTLELLKRGVRRGKQFPFRYLSAWKAVEAAGRPWARKVQNTLEECMGIACENLPTLQGRSAFLTDNSGSAWCTCTSEWGSMEIAEIGNLSSVIGAMCAEEGVVFPFGDRLNSVTIRKDEGVLKQAYQISRFGKKCGMATENGIWLFFRDALMQKQHWDNIFVYSDMQAGHGGLYGIYPEDYKALGACVNGNYIDVNMLVKLYRAYVNPKVNVFCIQTAGYSNVLVPEYGYRTAILYGWTGRELVFADAMNRTWNELESREPEKQ